MILALLTFGCQNKEIQVLDKTKDLCRRIDSLTIAKSLVDTVFVRERNTKQKLLKEKHTQEDIIYFDCLKQENEMLVDKICVLEQEKSQLLSEILEKE